MLAGDSTNIFRIKPPSISSILIWIIGLTILGGIALKDFLPILWQYQNNNVGTQIRVISRNSTVKPPFMVICANRGPSALPDLVDHILNDHDISKCSHCLTMANHSWDAWNWNITNVSQTRITLEHTLTSAFLEKFATTSIKDTIRILDRRNLDWNKPMVDSLLNLFACVSKMDTEAAYGKQGQYPHDCIDRYSDFELFEPDILIKLFDRLFILLCVNIKVSYFPFKDACLHSIHDSMLILYPDLFCASLPMGEHGFNLSVSSIYTDDEPSMLGKSTWIQIFSESAKGRPRKNPGRMLFKSDRTYRIISTGLEKVYMSYSIETAVLEKRNVPCYTENTPGTCIHTCIIKGILEHCRCIPFTARKLLNRDFYKNRFPFCTLALYSNCTFNQSGETEKCERQCQDPCEYVSYRWNVASYLHGEDGPRRYWVYVKPIVTPIVQFSIVSKDTPEQFLAKVGAVVNFYLGISGLTLIALVRCVIRFGKKWWDRIRKEKRERLNSKRVMIDSRTDQMRVDLESGNVKLEGYSGEQNGNISGAGVDGSNMDTIRIELIQELKIRLEQIGGKFKTEEEGAV